MLSLLIYKLGSLITIVFPLGFVYGLAACLAELQHLVAGRLRRAVRANVRQVLGAAATDAEVRRTARAVFRNFSYNIVDVLRTPRLTPAAMLDLIDVDGWEHVDRAQATGRGVLIISAHFGNWEWGGMMMAQRGFVVNAVALDHQSPAVTRYFDRRRRQQGVHTLPVEGSSHAIIRSLKRGECVAIMADRDVAHQGTETLFFGQPTMMPRAHASIAARTGALIVPAFLERTRGQRFCAHISAPIDPRELPNDDTLIDRIVEQSINVIEREVARDPRQWLVFEPIWAGNSTPAEHASVVGSTP